MITNIPTPDDFNNAGNDCLNMAWDNLSDLESYILNYEENYDPYTDLESTRFWEAAQKRFFQSMSFVQQANEFFLKGKIAAISPFLLINVEPRNWPKGCDKSNIPFSSFKTIDASELPKVFNTVCAPHLSDEFLNDFKKLRTTRNTIMHTVDKSLRFDIKDIYLAILKSFHNFNSTKRWIECRTEYLSERTTEIHLSGDDAVRIQVYFETTKAMERISRKEITKYFGITRARRYECPACNDKQFENAELSPDLVQLTPDTPQSKRATCFLCGKVFDVERKRCCSRKCKSDVLYSKKDIVFKNYIFCMLCGERQK